MEEEQVNIQLLFKYLTDMFEKIGGKQEEAEKMIYENSRNLFGFHGLAWELGKISLEFFCMYFLQDTFLVKDNNAAAPIADIHKELWKDIQDSIIGTGENQIGRICPRGTGKSAFGDVATVIWSHCYGYKKYSLICSDIGSTAEKFIKDIKNVFLENKYIENAFGKILDDKNKRYICNSTQLELTNKSLIEAISSASSMRGRKYDNCRPDLIILDDYQSEDDCRTEEAREKKWKKFSDDVKYAIQREVKRNGKVIKKGTTLIALGTLQHKECFYSRLIKLPTWKFKLYRGVLVDDFIDGDKIINGVDHLFNSGLWLEFKKILFDFKNDNRLEDAKEFYWKHEKEMQYPLLWIEFWDCLDMALNYYENSTSFKQEVQNDVDNIGEKWFKTVRTEPRTTIETHNFVKTMLLCDPASTNGRKSDYTAYLVGSQSDMDLLYGRSAELAKINARTEFDKYVNHMVDLLVKYTEITHVYIEKNTFNGADANLLEKKIEENELLRYRGITIINEAQRKNKDDKISTLIPVLNKGQMIIAEEDKEFIDQILDFRGSRYSEHDDAPDVTSEFNNRIWYIDETIEVELLDRRKLGV